MMNRLNVCFSLICAACFALVCCGCSDSPADVVKKDYEAQKFLKGDDMKKIIEAQIQETYQAMYDVVMAEENDAEIAKEEADAAVAEAKEQYKDWTDKDYKAAADARRQYLVRSKFTIDACKISGSKAEVSYTIKFERGLKTMGTRTLVKNKQGKWILQPEKADKEDEQKDETPVEPEAEE